MRYLPIAFLITTFGGILNSAQATMQACDWLLLNDETVCVLRFKLSPEMNQTIKEMRSSIPVLYSSSGNWDGFYAELELREEKLFLTKLSIDWIDEKGDFTTKDLELPGQGGVFCEWFSGILRDIKWGKRLHMKSITDYHFKDGVYIETTVRKNRFGKKVCDR